METSDLNDIRCALFNDAISYFEKAYQDTTKKTEPKILYYMHKDIDKLENLWNNTIKQNFPNKQLHIIPIFVHNQPIVDFFFPKDEKGKELGDLLYIHTDFKDSNGGYEKTQQTALLLQAKVNSNKNPDNKQVHLYAKWPKFCFRNKEFVENLSNNQFIVQSPPSYHKGARYLFIEDRDEKDPSPNIEERYYTVDVKKEPIDNKKDIPEYLFVNNLINLLDFTEGREVDIQEPPNDDWSKVINAISDWAIGKWGEEKKYKGEPRYKLLRLLRSTENPLITEEKFDFSSGPKLFPSDYIFDLDSKPFIIIHIITLENKHID